jgi:ornithine cyclodeaminase/alanine dehydrogenase-like protein (mu-crystallin family)
VAALLGLDATMEAVEAVFAAHGAGRTTPPGILSLHAPDGAFHIKAAIDPTGAYFVAKTNANFPDNPTHAGLPAIQGVVVLCDARDGRLLALLDSMQITLQRTGAATGVAARHLAREGAKSLAICGCGNQGRVSLRAIARVRALQQVWAFDRDFERAREFAVEMSQEVGLDVVPVRDLAEATSQSDMCVTATPATSALLFSHHVAPGAFVAAVGADNPGKQEIDARLLASSKVVVDILEQCAEIGDLHHALEAGAMRREDVHAELGQVIAGKRPGRETEAEIIVFDSTGMGLLDAAAAVLAYESALRTGAGTRIALGD